MYALPVIRKDQTEMFKSVTLIGSPISKLLERTKWCKDEAIFFDKEAIFLSWIVFQSQAYAIDEAKENLISLHRRLLHFKNHDLMDHLCALSQHQINLTAQSNCRYPPTSFAESYEAQRVIDDRFEDLCEAFKILKNQTFEMVEGFLTISIY